RRDTSLAFVLRRRVTRGTEPSGIRGALAWRVRTISVPAGARGVPGAEAGWGFNKAMSQLFLDATLLRLAPLSDSGTAVVAHASACCRGLQPTARLRTEVRRGTLKRAPQYCRASL